MKRAGFIFLCISGLIISTSDSLYFPWPNIVGALLFIYAGAMIAAEREGLNFK